MAAKLSFKLRVISRWHERCSRAQESNRLLIPNIKKCAEKTHGELTYELTQLFTRHGCFGVYRQRRKLGREIDKSREAKLQILEGRSGHSETTFLAVIDG